MTKKKDYSALDIFETIPVTGVIDSNSCDGEIYEEINKGIDLAWIDHRKECKYEDCQHEVSGRVLIGSWKKVWVWRTNTGGEFGKKPSYVETKRKKVYAPDESGEYAAIYNSDVYTIQVAWSKYTAYGPKCSPCYPRQASIVTRFNNEYGTVLLYTLPPHLLQGDDDA